MQSIAYLPASNGSANASLMTVTNIRAALANTIKVNTVANVPAKFTGTMGTPHNFTDPVTGETITIISEATAVDFFGSVSGADVIIDQIAAGYTDLGSKVGDIIVIKPTTEGQNNLKNILGAEHKDDGKHGALTVDSILQNTTFNDPNNQNLYSNAIINGGCMVAQRVIPNISTTYQYGSVDRFAAKATGTAVSAGTVTRITSSLLAATKGYDLKIAGLTVTGTGIAFLRYRMEAAEARQFINAAASFGVRVYHNVGSAVNYTVYIRKANAADNFVATTDIANSGVISVPNTTATWLKFENINSGSLGDVSNGIEIEIQIACGATTTKDFNFAEFTFNKGAKAAAYQPKPYQAELAACQRYFESSFPDGQLPANGANGTTFYDGNDGRSGYFSAFIYHISFGQVGGMNNFMVRKRAVPTMIGYGNNVGSWVYSQTGGGLKVWTGFNSGLACVSPVGFAGAVNASGSPDQGVLSGHWTADAEL